MTKMPLLFYEKYYDNNNLLVLNEYKENQFTTLIKPFRHIKKQSGKPDTNNDFYEKWIQDKSRLCYNKVEFLPPPIIPDNLIFNSFSGFNYTNFVNTNTVDFTIIQDHIKYLCGSELNIELFNYLEQYIANIILEPGKLSRVSILMKSIQGTGKNLFFENFFKNVLYGDAVLSSSNADDFFGKFADTSKVFIGLFDEASGKDTFSINNFMKTAISNDKKRVEKKGKDTIQSDNYTRFICFSNENGTPIQIEHGDRRHIAIECDNKKIEKDYIDNLIEALENKDILNSYINYLKTIYNKNYDWINNRPLTSYYRQLQSVNISQYELFITNLI